MTNLPTSFSIDSSNKMYYNAKDICSRNPELFIGIKSKRREIIERNKIPFTEYVYACFNVKFNCWNISDKYCSKAQLLISKEWVDIHMFMFNNPSQDKKNNTQTKKIKSDVIKKNDVKEPVRKEDEEKDVENPPPILELKDSQKFRDIDGNFINIEIRGERCRNKIFFRLKDVMRRFDMPNLSNGISDKTSSYIRGLHYTCFKCFERTQTNYRKILYLSYYGFLRVINVSRANSEFLNKNINILTKWLDNLINNKCFDNYYLLNYVEKNTSGLIYIISSPLIHAIKIGYWTGTINSLKSRYIMVFGKDIELYYKYVDNARMCEYQIHQQFKKYNISGELFEKENLKLYTDFLENTIEQQTTREIIVEETIYDAEEDDDDDEIYYSERETNEVARLKTEIIVMKLKHQLEVQEEKFRTMEERKEKERFQVLVETNERIHALEKAIMI